MERAVEVVVYAWVGAVLGITFLIAVLLGLAAIWAIMKIAFYVLDKF